MGSPLGKANPFNHAPSTPKIQQNHITHLSYPPQPTATKRFFCKQFLEFLTKKNAPISFRYHTDTIPKERKFQNVSYF